MGQPPHRVVSGRAYDEDARLDASVRPKRLADFIGQARQAPAKEAAQVRAQILQEKAVGRSIARQGLREQPAQPVLGFPHASFPFLSHQGGCRLHVDGNKYFRGNL